MKSFRFKSLISFLFFSLTSYAAVYNIGPGKTYTNIGDAPWASMSPGDTMMIYPKTLLTAVTSGTPTTITFTGNTTSGSTTITGVSVSSAQNLWVGEGFTCGTNTPPNTAILTISGTTITFISGTGTGASSTVTGQACTGSGKVITLSTSAGSIPNGSAFWYAGAVACSPTVITGCIYPTQVTCGTYGSGLYGTSTGGTACAGNNVTVSENISIPNGTTVYFLPPYYEKIIVSASGNSGNPITIEGIPDSTTGLLPVLDIRNSTTGTNMSHGGSVGNVDQLGYIIFAWNAAETSYPNYIIFEDLRWQNTQDGISVEYDSTNTPYTNIGGYGMRVNDCVNCTFQYDEPMYNGIGIFAADYPGANPANVVQNITIQNTHFYRNGALSGAHQTYVESRGALYQFDNYDLPAFGSACNQLKDRSSGTIVRYNYFTPSARATDLINAQNSLFDNIQMNGLLVPTGGFTANATSLTFTSIPVVASTTAGSENVTIVSGGSSLQNGMRLVGTGIPSNAQIANVHSPTSVVLNYPATATGSSVAMVANSVQGISIGDVVGYDSSVNGWGYSGSGQPLMPTVASINTSTNTITLNSPGIPTAVAAGQELQVIYRALNPYQQTFEYGNVFNWDEDLYQQSTGIPIHYGWDSAAGIDSNFDRAGTLYYYDNTFIAQWDQSVSPGRLYDLIVFQTESNADNVVSYNNLWYVTNAPGSGNPATYFILAGTGLYTGTGLVSVNWPTGGNSQITTSPSQGSNTSCGITVTGWSACGSSGGGSLASGAALSLSAVTTESPASLYPSGVTGSQFKLQTGSTAIGAASVLPAVIASNTLGVDATPYFQPDGTVRSNLLDLGAWQYSSSGATILIQSLGTLTSLGTSSILH